MITEQYVSFDTAKMLKEVGFDCIVNKYYHRVNFSNDVQEKSVLRAININKESRNYSRPTQALAARWLREVHDISILLTPLPDGWMVDLFDLTKYQYILCNKDTMADTYEEALEDGLQEALRVIIKRKEARND